MILNGNTGCPKALQWFSLKILVFLGFCNGFQTYRFLIGFVMMMPKADANNPIPISPMPMAQCQWSSANANGPVPIPPMQMAQCHCQDRWTIWLKNINDSIKIINWLSELDELLPVAHCQWSNGDPRPVLVVTFQCPPCQWPNAIAKGDWLLD